MDRKRDFKAEYQRRIMNAAKRGLSRTQGRGHGRRTDTPIRPLSVSDRERFEAALKLYRQNGNQAEAAKSVQLAPERLRRFLNENVQVEGRGRTLKITDNRNREMSVISKGAKRNRILRDFDQASINGEHLNAVRSFLASNDIAFLTPFHGRSVIDARGKLHPFEVDPNMLHRIAHSDEAVFHEIYRLVI